MKLALALALLASGAPLSAQAYQCRVPQAVTVPQIRSDGPTRRAAVTGYTLALSWSPEFCNGREEQTANAVQCSKRNGRFGLVVHGLWPEGRGGWPQWCPTARTLSPAEARANMCMIPSARMQATEWAKHGACMVRTPAGYFKVTRILFEGLRLPDLDRLSKEPDLTAGMIRTRFAAANPGWRADAVGVKLNQRGWLEELRLCYGKDFMPKACDRRRFGPKDEAPLKIWRGL